MPTKPASTRPADVDRDDPFMSVNDIAGFLAVHRAMVYRWMAEGRLPYVEVGPYKRRRVRQSEVRKLIAEQ